MDEAFRQVVGLVQDGVWIADEAYQTTFVNERMAAMLGCTVEQMIGTSIWQYVDDEARGSIERTRRGAIVGLPITFRRQDGTELWTQITTIPVGTGGSPTDGLAMIVVDATLRREVAAEAKRVKLRDRVDSLTRIGGSLSNLVGQELDDVCEGLAREVGTVAGDFALVCLSDPAGNEVRLRGAHHVDPAAEAFIRDGYGARAFQRGEGMTGTVFAAGEPMVITEVVVERDRLVAGEDLAPLFDLFGVRSIVCAPLLRRGATTGVLITGRSLRAEPYDDDDVAFVFAVAEQATMAIDNAQLHQALRASEDWFRLIQHHAPTGLATIGFDGRFEQVNPVLCAITGRSEAELVGLPSVAIVHPDDVVVDEEDLHRLLTGEVANTTREVRYVRPDGSTVWVLVALSALRDGRGELAHLIAQVVDITERKRGELLLSATLANAPDLLCTVGLDGRLRAVSPSWTTTLGWSEAELVGQPFLGFVHPDDRAGAEADLAAGVDEGRSRQQFECRCLNKAGGFRWQQWNTTAVLDAGTIVGSARDVTEQRRQAAALRQSNDDLAQFASIAAHDLKSPVGLVSGFAELLAHQSSVVHDEVALELAGEIGAAAQRLVVLVDDLLDYSQVGAGAASIDTVDLAVLAGEVVAGLRAELDRSGAVITVGTLPRVAGDAGHLRQLLQNLVSNAIKFVPPSRRPEIHIEAERTADGWLLAVADNGIGIAAEDADQVFKMFKRLDTSGDVEGSGIGLAICRRVVERHGGTIWLEPNTPVGTRVRFTMPGPRSGADAGSQGLLSDPTDARPSVP